MLAKALLSRSKRVTFHHHHPCNFTERQNTTFISSPQPWPGPPMPVCPGGTLAVLLGLREGARGVNEQPSLAHLPLLQPHLVLISSLTRGWLSSSAGSHLSPLECIRIFRKQVVSEVRPGREKDCPRFPTPPPPFSGFDGKAVSMTCSPTAYTHPPGSQPHKAGRDDIPVLIEATTEMLTWGKNQTAQTLCPPAKPASSESHLGKEAVPQILDIRLLSRERQ